MSMRRAVREEAEESEQEAVKVDNSDGKETGGSASWRLRASTCSFVCNGHSSLRERTNVDIAPCMFTFVDVRMML